MRNFEFLGAAVGDDDFVQAETAAGWPRQVSCSMPWRSWRLLCACAVFSRMLRSRRLPWPSLTPLSAPASQGSLASTRLKNSGAKLVKALLRLVWACDQQPPMLLLPTLLLWPPNHGATIETATASKQHDLSDRIDSAHWEALVAIANPVQRATLRSEAGHRARAFLAAQPAGKTRIFTIELRVQLGLPDAFEDTGCPRCDGMLERRSYRAGMCVVGGDRTQRHDAVRDLVSSGRNGGCSRRGKTPVFRPSKTLTSPGEDLPMSTCAP